MTNEAHKAGIEAALSAWYGRAEIDEEEDAKDIADMASAIQAYLQASGLVLVPKEPHADMVLAATKEAATLDFTEAEDVYTAMLAAAPKPFGGE